MGLPRGRVLGGSSSINGMIYVRGQREDYDRWRELGNRGWSLRRRAAVLQAQRGPGARRRRLPRRAAARSRSRTRASASRSSTPSSPRRSEAGLPPNADFNGAEQEGVGLYQLTVRDGRRSSAANAFLRPARAPAEPARRHRRAARRDRASRARAPSASSSCAAAAPDRALRRREVIVSAGAIGSPQLLQLSGIGEPRGAARARAAGGARAAGRRPQPAGSLPGAAGLQTAPADHAQRHAADRLAAAC